MGDHRPKITCDFEMHGHKAYYDFGWCNWSDNGYGIDQRIVDWFAEQVGISMMNYQTQIDASFAEQNKVAIEKQEREELARLKAKYADKPNEE